MKPPGPASRPGSSRVIRLAGAAAAAYAVLTVLVATGLADTLDIAARQWFRPDDLWGPMQLRVDTLVEGLRPTRVVPVLPLVAVLAAVLRRSWAPVRVALLVLLLSGGLVLLSKLVVSRPDTHGEDAHLGGSYPSGHVAALLAVLGGCLLVIGTRRWWAWAVVALLDLVMGVCLLLEAAHWFTDVVGGVLLSTCVLATVAAVQQRAGPGVTPRVRAAPARRRAPR